MTVVRLKEGAVYCKKCGKRVNEGEQFCTSCGAPLAGETAGETAHLDPDDTVIAYPESSTPASSDDTDIIYHAAPGSAARLDDTLITHSDDTLLVRPAAAHEEPAAAEPETPAAAGPADAAAHEAAAAPRPPEHESEDEDEVGDAAFAPKEGNFMPTVAIPTVSSQDDEAADSQDGAGKPTPAKPKSRKPLIVGIVIAAIAVVAVLLGVFISGNLVPKPTSTVVNVKFSIDAPGYDSKDSALPVEVTGTTSGGSAYDQDFFIDPGGNGVELAPGSYSLAVKASPLLDDGNLYTVPTSGLSFEIPQAVQDGATFEVPNGTISLSYASPADITDAQIDSSYDMAITSGFDKATADAYKKALVKNRNEAVAAKKAADEKAAAQAAQQAEAAEAAKKAAEEAAKPVTWYRATAHTPTAANEAAIYSLSVSGNTLTADAAFDEAASYEGLSNTKAPQERKTYTFTLTKDTKCYSVGGEGAPQQITIDQVAQAVSSQSGLAVIIEVRGDNVLEVRLAS